MKPITKLALAGITAALLATGSAFANDTELRTVDNHHGTVTYFARPAQTQGTIAFAGHAKVAPRSTGTVSRDEGGFREIATPHGTVNYFAPAR